MKRLFAVAAAFAFACTSIVSPAWADTSYLLFQGPFGVEGSTTTFKWKVNYDPGQLTHGGDLLAIILGTPSDTGTTKHSYDYWTSSAGGISAGYLFFPAEGGVGGTLLIESITIGGTSIAMSSDWNHTWHYNVAGGAGEWNFDEDNPAGLYADGFWSYANDAMSTRLLSDGSFDAWVFGAATPENLYELYVDGVFPLESYFSDAVVIDLIPEPGSVALGLTGVASLWLARRRRKATSR